MQVLPTEKSTRASYSMIFAVARRVIYRGHGVPEAVAIKITGHKIRSMYRRYRIVDERDLPGGDDSVPRSLGTTAENCVCGPFRGLRMREHGQFPVTENLHDVQRLPND
jgi:hypothetical protein